MGFWCPREHFTRGASVHNNIIPRRKLQTISSITLHLDISSQSPCRPSEISAPTSLLPKLSLSLAPSLRASHANLASSAHAGSNASVSTSQLLCLVGAALAQSRPGNVRVPGSCVTSSSTASMLQANGKPNTRLVETGRSVDDART